MATSSGNRAGNSWKRIKHWAARKAANILNDTVDSTYLDRQERLGKFWFLMDVPLFIDGTSIGQLFDAMVRPEWQATSRTRTAGTTSGASVKAKGEVEAKAGIPYFLDKSVKLGTEVETNSKDERSRALSEEANRSPEMNLEKIVNRYVADFPERLLYATQTLTDITDLAGNTHTWNTVEDLLKAPGIRPLIVLDLVPGAKIMPMFAETDEGEDINMSSKLVEAVRASGAAIDDYPKDSDLQCPEKSKAHWEALASAFDSTRAMMIVEEAKARLDWIDYRLIAANASDPIPIHLHCLSRGAYPTGTFAYQFIRRASKHGIRIIGTLKLGKDVNVLGVYEC